MMQLAYKINIVYYLLAAFKFTLYPNLYKTKLLYFIK